jgi:hypothetical protein
MKYYLAFIMFVLCLGFVAIGTAHHGFSHSFPEDESYGLYYLDLYKPEHYYGPYWSYPYYPYAPYSDVSYSYVPAKIALQATKERLWANKYLNPNSVHSKVQESKERLWAVKNPYYGSRYDYGRRE